jgi:hypothetical protein
MDSSILHYPATTKTRQKEYSLTWYNLPSYIPLMFTLVLVVAQLILNNVNGPKLLYVVYCLFG